MAATQLGLYNDALTLLGQRRLSTLTDDHEPRYVLDDIYAIDAVDYCLELVEPQFAKSVSNLTSSVASADHAFDNVFTLPSDYVSFIELYADDTLDEKITRYLISGNTIACSDTSVYLRYVSNGFALSVWSPAFTKVVAAYLARELAERIAPTKYEEMDAKFLARLETAQSIAKKAEPQKRATPSVLAGVNQLGLYNNALTLMGLPALRSATDDIDIRYRLDEVYGMEAVSHCLEVSKPTFSRSVSKLTSSSASTEHDLDNVFTLPSDYVTMVGVFSDANLDEEIHRYVISGRTIACNYSTIYVHYVSDGFTFTDWSPSFGRLVSAYLAKEISGDLPPEKIKFVYTEFDKRLAEVQRLANVEELRKRPDKTTATLTDAWRHIYNDALLIMGLDTITTNTDDSERRAKLDKALDTGVVADLLEDTRWTFGTESMKSFYDPSLEPDYGYTRVHDEPPKMHVIHGIFEDEYMEVPHKFYNLENNRIYTNLDELYIRYISTDYLVNPSNWPTYFKRLVAAGLAKSACLSLAGADKDNAFREYDTRKKSAKSTDAQASPPRRLASGNWVSERYRGSSYGRPRVN